MTATQITTSTPTKTPFPINTLTVAERENFLRKYLSNSSNCKLPCWWDITPGQTAWLETEQLLNFWGFRVGSVPGTEPTTIWHGTGGFDFQGLSTKHNNGEITLSVRYNPWGKPIETNGIGNFDASYIGTLIDATTGLIYVGNGQYGVYPEPVEGTPKRDVS